MQLEAKDPYRVQNTKFESSAKTHFWYLYGSFASPVLPRGTGVPTTPLALALALALLLSQLGTSTMPMFHQILPLDSPLRKPGGF